MQHREYPDTHCLALQEDYIAPLVGFLSSDANEETTGSIFQVAAGWIAQIRWQRTGGYGFPVNVPLTPEAVISKWTNITDFSECTLRQLRMSVCLQSP